MDDDPSHSSSTGDGPPPNFHWYTLQTISNYEARAQKAVLQQARMGGMGALVGRILFPVQNICDVRNGQRRVVRRKLYPGYLFAELDLFDGEGNLRHELWQLLRGTQGVSGFVGSDRPTPLKQAEVDSILAHVAVQDEVREMGRPYEVGAPVKITDGPFAGSSGEVESVDVKAGTLRVGVGLFGRKTPVDLEFWQVAKEEV
ncbi:MAG: transcription termination/antitermination protein NusG [Puniceicoccales bacterium]|jgi:transcriptional antiterminator NusG|nr:transcription termination/antitermination protein NusG [Puniceicoccales bacterium]